MSEISTELLSRLVIGRKLDGRCTYDPKAKAEVVQACLQPGVSVAKIGMQCGINANLLRRWIGERQRVAGAQRPVAPLNVRVLDSAFVPLQLEAERAQSTAVQAVMLQLHVRLANGVEFDLGEAGPAELSSVIRLLSSLPCSSSTAR
jgi:transposase